MSRPPVMMTAAAVLCAALVTGADATAGAGVSAAARAAALTSSGTWGTAEEIPGSQPLNPGASAGVASMSCASSTICSAGGSVTSGFTSTSAITQAYVVNKTGGIWRKAQEVPGTAALNVDGRARLNSVSCAAPGDCSAGGYYKNASGQQPFVVNETNRIWGSAQQVPGIAALNVGQPGSAILSVSCAAPGDCSAGGYYSDASGHWQAFVVDETGGTWGSAEEVPGTASLNAGGYAEISSVWCGAVGDCSAGGFYASSTNDGIPVSQAFVVDETGGTWGSAEEVPGTASLNGGGYAAINSVSCDSAGNCSAGGEYTSSTPATQAFVVSETGGTWGSAQEVPGTATLNVRRLAEISAMSCTAPGDCSAGGFYADASFNNQAFVVDETGGTWGSAQEVPGTATLDQGSPGAVTDSVSCAAPGDCSAGGYYTDSSGFEQAYIVNETGGTWGSAEEVPGTAALNGGGQAATQQVSCAPAGNCSAGGLYKNSHNALEVFAVNESS